MSESRHAVGEGLDHDVLRPDLGTSSADYAGRFAGAVGDWFLDVQARAVVDGIAAAASGRCRVLDVGGGHGQLTDALIRAGHGVVVHGSDSACHLRLRDRWPALPRVVSPLWQLPFGDASFDVVVAVRLLAHVERWRELILELSRVSRHGVLVDVPLRGALQRFAPALFGVKRRVEGNTRPYFDYELADIDAAFNDAGRAVALVRRQFGAPMALHRMIGSPGLSRAVERCAAALGYTARFGSPAVVLATDTTHR